MKKKLKPEGCAVLTIAKSLGKKGSIGSLTGISRRAHYVKLKDVPKSQRLEAIARLTCKGGSSMVTQLTQSNPRSMAKVRIGMLEKMDMFLGGRAKITQTLQGMETYINTVTLWLASLADRLKAEKTCTTKTETDQTTGQKTWSFG